MYRFLAGLFGNCIICKARRRRSGSQANQLSFQSLENRELLAGVYLHPSTAILAIFGDAGDNTATTSISGSNVRVSFANVGTFDYPLSSIASLEFIGFAGNDTFRNNTSINSRLVGHTGNDSLTGGSGNDILNGGPGDDVALGLNGNDYLLGVQGNDELRGGNGNDTVIGSVDGMNAMFGDAGDDIMYGGNRADTMDGGSGRDQMFGLDGDDVINTGSGGTAGSPGTANADFAMGNNGNDTIISGAGVGLHVFFGGNGDDILIGGISSENRLHGQDGNDTITGGHRNDFLRGLNGNDIISGSAGDDIILGGTGNDSLYGDGGTDILLGEAGNDGLFPGVGRFETAQGGSGADRFLLTQGDTAGDRTSGDVELLFVGSWNDAELQAFDGGLRALHHRTGATTILKDTTSTNPLRFEKVSTGSIGANIDGFNELLWQATINADNQIVSETYTRTIKIADWNENNASANDVAALSAIHEISHNWDSVYEINQRLSGRGSIWNSFKARSNWINSNPGNYIQGLSQTQEPFERTSQHQIITKTWWYHPNSVFARIYGTNNPKEDWGTVWESVFVEEITADPDSIVSEIVPNKVAVVESLFNLL